MKKLKNWMIRKLGGYTNDMLPIFKYVPQEVTTSRIVLPLNTRKYLQCKSMDYDSARALAIRDVESNISSALGRLIIDSELYDREIRRNFTTDNEEVVYTLRIAKP